MASSRFGKNKKLARTHLGMAVSVTTGHCTFDNHARRLVYHNDFCRNTLARRGGMFYISLVLVEHWSVHVRFLQEGSLMICLNCQRSVWARCLLCKDGGWLGPA
ncbi:hypothetical protein EVAR_70025_1 [Eumeta japonica]|uniref:Uncharacterized protein n=1 Tax=Eumeta variegata TaxID=151549 RepID=A0A4C1SEL6_EUMVA|nr:hypothetical protein EVAR_70025_1 [Eumeta japonica]